MTNRSASRSLARDNSVLPTPLPAETVLSTRAVTPWRARWSAMSAPGISPWPSSACLGSIEITVTDDAAASSGIVQGQVDQRLDSQIVFVASMLTAGDDSVIALAGNADGPPFDRPAHGWYWEVVGPRNVLRSGSLEGASIAVPEFRRPPREERPARAEGTGPRDAAVHFSIRQLMVGRAPVTIVATAPRAAVNGPLREAMTTLAISLAMLGLALVLAIVLQVRLGCAPSNGFARRSPMSGPGAAKECPLNNRWKFCRWYPS